MATIDGPHGTLHYQQAGSDAFDNYPPKLFCPLIAAARVGALTPVLVSLKARPARSLPSAYGWLSHRQLPHATTRAT